MTPPSAERPQGGPQGQPGNGPGGDRPVGPPQDNQGGPGQNDQGPGGRDNNRRPPAPVPPEIQRFQSYIAMVTQYGKLAADPEATGVAAVVSAGDILRKSGPQAAIDFFTKTLPDVKFDAVKRAIRLQLVDLYKANNQQDKALEQLQVLITADNTATASPGSTSSKQP
jgi:hypothetical protein